MRIYKLPAWVERVATGFSSWYERRWCSTIILNVLGHILGALSICFGVVNSASADHVLGSYGSAYGNYDPLNDPWMAKVQRLSEKNEQIFQQTMESLNQKKMESEKQLINHYRQETGDYSSSDQDAVDRAMAKIQQERPEEWARFQNKLQQNRQMFENSQAMISEHGNHVRQLNGISNDNRNQTMEGLSEDYTDYLRDQDQWVNPNTGEVTTLPNGTPGTYYSEGGEAYPSYYQSPDGQYREIDSNGFETVLEPFDP